MPLVRDVIEVSGTWRQNRWGNNLGSPLGSQTAPRTSLRMTPEEFDRNTQARREQLRTIVRQLLRRR